MPQPENDLKTLLEQNGQVETPQEAKSDPKPQPKKKTPVAASREGKVVMQGHFSKQVHNQMRMLCIETDKSIQELLEEAVNALFTMHNKPPIV